MIINKIKIIKKKNFKEKGRVKFFFAFVLILKNRSNLIFKIN